MYKLFTRSCLLLLWWIIPAYAAAQIPGYQGKKASLQADILTFPAFRNATSVGGKTGNNPGYYGFNWRLRATFDYVIRKKVTMGLDGCYFQTATTARLINPGSSTISQRNLAVEGFSAGLNFKFYTKRYLAPQGFFVKLGFHALFMHISDPKNGILPSGEKTDSFTGAMVLETGIGRKHIFAKRLIFNYGFDINLVTPPFIYGFLGYNNDTPYNLNELDMIATQRMNGHQFFNLYTGFGVLLF